MKRVTHEWVRKAEGDYRAALRESKARSHDLVCFLSQHSALKAAGEIRKVLRKALGL